MKKSIVAGVLTSAVAVAVASVGVVVSLETGATGSAPPTSAVRPAGVVDPANFSTPRANPYYPLRPGTRTILRGSDGSERLREVVRVTHRTRVIQGVTTTVVSDVVRRRGGSLVERTTDWYAADNDGNVWYFGERTATYDESGKVESREGTWLAGRDGAVPGKIMPANPGPAQAYRQEFYRGHAEDQAWLVNRSGRVRVPAGRFRHVLRSYEWTRLEPGVVSLKLYAPGVGIVKERDVSGGKEKFVLVSVRR